jgi:hypothetical protein
VARRASTIPSCSLSGPVGITTTRRPKQMGRMVKELCAVRFDEFARSTLQTPTAFTAHTWPCSDIQNVAALSTHLIMGYPTPE